MAKPHNVEEPAGTYTASPKRPAKSSASTPAPAKGDVRYLDSAAATKLADKIFSERKNLLHKLAQ